MTDHFLLLQMPRRPWLDPEGLKERFFALSSTVHPDRVHHLGEAQRTDAQQRYSLLNAAYQCLREPRLRARHLLELELGAKPSDLTQVPEDLMSLFFELNKAFSTVDALLKEKEGVVSPLLKVGFFERGLTSMETLNHLQERLRSRRNSLWEELKALDAGWTSPPLPQVQAKLEELCRLLSFFDRWLAQAQERAAQLSF